MSSTTTTTTTTTEKPAAAPAKPKTSPGKRASAAGGAFKSLGNRLLPAVTGATAFLRKRLLPSAGRVLASTGASIRKRLPALKRAITDHKQLISAARQVGSFLDRHGRRHLKWLEKLPAWLFVPIAGLWALAFQVAAVPLAALIAALILRPLGIARLFETPPITAMTDALTRWTYDLPLLNLGWERLTAVNRFVLAALLLPALCTLIAQLVPLEALAKVLRSKRWRIALSLAAAGVLYFLAWGEPALILTGALVAIPLTWTYLHWRKRSSTVRACLVTCGVHAIAAAVAILCRGFLGGA